MAILPLKAPVRKINHASHDKTSVTNGPNIDIKQHLQDINIKYRNVRGTYTACVDSYKYESEKKNLVLHCTDCTTSNVSLQIRKFDPPLSFKKIQVLRNFSTLF